jgi:hypothetical protein
MNELTTIHTFLTLQQGYASVGLTLRMHLDSDRDMKFLIYRENEQKEHEFVFSTLSLESADTYLSGYTQGLNHQEKGQQVLSQDGSFLGKSHLDRSGNIDLEDLPDVETGRWSPGGSTSVLTISPEEAQKEIADIEANRTGLGTYTEVVGAYPQPSAVDGMSEE